MTDADKDIAIDIEAADDTEAEAPRAGRPWWQRILIGLGVLVVVVVVAGLALYNFGGMGGSAYDPEIRQQYEAGVASGAYIPVQKHFTIPIPGCTCHSTDPRLTEEHRYRHMNQCMTAGCHG